MAQRDHSGRTTMTSPGTSARNRTARREVEETRRAVARLLIVRTGLASLVALAACSSGGSPSGTARGSSQTTAPSTATVVAARLGAPPSCPGASVPIGTAGPYGEVVGRSPLWGGFYADVDRDAGTFAAPDAPRTASGR